MKFAAVRVCTVMAAVLFLSISVLELNAEARAGGSRSMGSRSSRSYSRPVSPPTASPSRQQAAPTPGAFQQQQGGGFMRSMAGGLAGGMLGSMLFSGIAGAGGGMGGSMGSGIGLFEIILLAGGGYLIYRYIKKKKLENPTNPFNR